jgi:hypothetical protein
MRLLLPLLGGLALAPGLALGAEANGPHIDSVYTDVDFDQCTTIESDEIGATSVCPGYRGYPVVIGDSDLRMSVSYGVRPLEEKAASQGFAPFNHIGKKIEWRIESDDDTFQPRATILRWYLSGEDGTDKYQILVVTQLKLGATCHIAYIDALTAPDANEKARAIADQEAGSFDCRNEPEIVQPFKAPVPGQ